MLDSAKSPERKAFDVIRISPEGNWFGTVADRLIEGHGVRATARYNRGFQTLMYIAWRLGTRRIVVHTNYWCRDYIGDYAALYCRMATPPATRTVRLLFLATDGPEDDENVLWKPQDLDLLGFAVIRPTEDCLVGRSVFRECTRPDFLPCSEDYRLHLYGGEMFLDGVPWLEQDRSLVVCGGVALWICAFHTETREHLGHFCPGELTEIARRHVVVGHPSQGMTGQEWASVIQEWPGFQPFSGALAPEQKDKLREAVNHVHSLIESKICVILGYWTDENREDGHAVAVMGHGLQDTPCEYCKESGGEIRSTSDWINYLVVVDDQESPYRRLPVQSLADAAGKYAQPAGGAAAKEWASWDGQPQTKPDFEAVLEKTSAMFDCELLMCAPIPQEVRVTPVYVLAIARRILKELGKRLRSIKEYESLPKDLGERLEELASFPQRFALRPVLQRLWQFHDDLKTHPCVNTLAQPIRIWYLKMEWPTWIWNIQVVRLARAPGKDSDSDPVDWSKSKVIGEVLIDATDGPTTRLGGLVSIRLGRQAVCVSTDPDHPLDIEDFEERSEDGVSYLLVPPKDGSAPLPSTGTQGGR